MTIRLLVSLFVFAVMGWQCTVTCLARPSAPYFYDDFEDGNHQDASPVTWEPLSFVSGGEMKIVDGSLVLTPSDELPIIPGATQPEMDARVADHTFKDLSFRTQFRGLDTGEYWIGVTARNSTVNVLESASLLWAAIHTNGELAFGSVVDTDGFSDPGDLTFYGRTQTNLRPVANDIDFQFDLFDTTIQLTAWKHGDPKPSRPILQYQRLKPSLNVAGKLEIWNQVSPIDSDKSAAFRYVSVLPTTEGPNVPGDFDQDGQVTVADLDALTLGLRENTTNLWYDVNYDQLVDSTDRMTWIHDIARTWFGDANLDRLFDSSDFTEVFLAGQYEDGMAQNSTWGTGDWNGDGEFTSADFVAAFLDGGYEAGPRMNAVAVPEPTGPSLVLLGLVWQIGLVTRLTKRRR